MLPTLRPYPMHYSSLLWHPYAWDRVDAIGHCACFKDQGEDSGKVVELLRTEALFRPSSCASFLNEEGPSLGKQLFT